MYRRITKSRIALAEHESVFQGPQTCPDLLEAHRAASAHMHADQMESHPDACDDLDALLASSRTVAGREHLLAAGTLAALASRLPQLCEDSLAALSAGCTQDAAEATAPAHLISTLRIMRNCCAAGVAAADMLVQLSVHQYALCAADRVCQKQLTTTSDAAQQLLLVAVQLAANMSMASTAAATAIWTSWFPEQLQQLLAAGGGAVHAAISLCLLAACKASPQVCAELCSPAATGVWLLLLRPLMVDADVGHDHHQHQQQQQQPQQDAASAPAAIASQENLGLLLRWLVVQGAGLQPLLEQVLSPTAVHGVPSGTPVDGAAEPQQVSHPSDQANTGAGAAAAAEAPPGSQWTAAQLLLLHLLAHEMELAPQQAAPATAGEEALRTASSADAGPTQEAWLGQLLACLKAAAADAAPGPMEACLQVLLALVKRPDAGRALASGQDAVDVLQGMGLVEFLLGLLQSLGPPVNPRAAARQQQQQNQVLPSAVQNTAGQEGEAAEGPSGAGVSHQQQQQLPPRGQAMYPGYRSDLVSILGNCLCGRRRVQDAVLAGGGVELLLSCCQLDTAAPLAKEWALWAVRNLCEGNSEVQQYISELKVQDTVESAELDKLGKKLQLDKHTGKLKVVSKEPSDGPPADAPPPHPAQQQQPQ